MEHVVRIYWTAMAVPMWGRGKASIGRKVQEGALELQCGTLLTSNIDDQWKTLESSGLT